MNTCDTCKHWTAGQPDDYGECRGLNCFKAICDPLAYMLTGNTTEKTGPKFGCIHHEPSLPLNGGEDYTEAK